MYTPQSPSTASRAGITWLAFLLFGALDTVLLLEFPGAGVVVLLLALAGVVARRPRGAALAGLLLGAGATWSGLMLRVKVSCDAFNTVPGQECEAPGIETWIVVGLAILGLGVIASILVATRGGAGSRG